MTESLFREINCLIIAFVPKCENLSECKDYRPISCCKFIYKCITKIMTNRLKCILPPFINKDQATFVGGRRINDNIILCNELINRYYNEVVNVAR